MNFREKNLADLLYRKKKEFTKIAIFKVGQVLVKQEIDNERHIVVWASSQSSPEV